jgi:hypothetical protein
LLQRELQHHSTATAPQRCSIVATRAVTAALQQRRNNTSTIATAALQQRRSKSNATLQATTLPSLQPSLVRRPSIELPSDFRRTVLRPACVTTDITTDVIVLRHC